MYERTKDADAPTPRLTGWAAALFFTCLVAAYGLVRSDMVVSAEFRIARVLAVQQVAGMDAASRLVVADLGEYQRALRTSDRMVRTDPGQTVCVKRSTYLLRRWVRHALVPPGYCPALRVARRTGALEAGPLAD